MSDAWLAYVDPGSGSLIIQVLIAAIIAVPVFFRTQIGRLTARLRGGSPSAPPPTDAPDGD